MATIGERIAEKAFELLDATPKGIQYSELVRRVTEQDRTFNQNSVRGTVWQLFERFPDRVYKPSRGLYR